MRLNLLELSFKNYQLGYEKILRVGPTINNPILIWHKT